MALTAGGRLGPYEVVAQIGEGGMGQVYRATDTTLKRPVAIKILPPSLAADVDRLARFQREAEVLASLNHPNIAGIYGIEESQDLRALVMEFVEGEDLSQRIARGAIPLDEALSIAKQIADALEAAHEQGIIHRDLKPANIKVRGDGTVKVLDFGLAKVTDVGRDFSPTGAGPKDPACFALTQSPTITTPAMTQAGIILGTAAYMAPEQAKGRIVDRRADIWAFGAVLFEMLTGQRAFAGEDVSDTLANVLKMEPDWERLPAEVPARVRQVIRACLQKNPKQRIGDVQDVRLALGGAFDTAASASSTTTFRPGRRREYVWAAATLVLVIAIAILAVRTFRTAAPQAATVRFDVSMPDAVRVDRNSMAFSPDGQRIAFAASAESKTLLWVRPLDASNAQPLPGTEEASRPFWSPDSQSIAFFAQGKLKKVAATGGPLQVLCNLSSTGTHNGTWSADGVILFAPNDGGPILRVPSAGGRPTPASELNASKKETRHSYPNFLPDGRHYLYLTYPGPFTYVGMLDSKERSPVPDVVSEAKYSSTGHLIFLQNGSVMAQPFDIRRLQLAGEALQIVEQLSLGPLAPFSVSSDGDLAYTAGHLGDSQLAWFDRTGRQVSIAAPTGEYRNLALSPDGRFVAFERGAPADIWVLELEKRLVSRFTSNAGADTSPVWSPDGRTIAFASDRDGGSNLYERAFGVVGEEKLLMKIGSQSVSFDWSRDGRYLAFGRSRDIWAISRSGDRDPQAIRVTETPSTELQASFSADGRWVAYASTESGRYEVYVQSFPQPGIKQQVSTTGGVSPRWKSDARELFYVSPDGTLMAVQIKPAGSSLEVSTPSPLFQTGLPYLSAVDPSRRSQYDVSTDGRFLMGVTSAEQSTHIAVILNWSPGQR